MVLAVQEGRCGESNVGVSARGYISSFSPHASKEKRRPERRITMKQELLRKIVAEMENTSVIL